MIKPEALKPGDTVGLLSPASPLFEESYLDYIYSRLSGLGLKWKIGRHSLDSWGDLAGVDESRLKDFHDMWADPDIKAIIPIRGGNGSVRLLPYLDFELIARNPKILIGFSDITGLLIPIHQQTDLVTFHGSMAKSFFDSAYSFDYFVRALMQAEPLGEIHDPPGLADLFSNQKGPGFYSPEYPPPRVVLSEGEAEGRLIGGCLTLIKQLMGTPWEIDTRDKLLFIEDVQEEPHAIDRMLSQLELAGKLDQAAGIIVGQCIRCNPGESQRRVLSLNHNLEMLLRERLAHLDKPVVYGLRIGHSRDRCTLPLGVRARLSASRSRNCYSSTISTHEKIIPMEGSWQSSWQFSDRSPTAEATVETAQSNTENLSQFDSGNVVLDIFESATRETCL